MEIINREQTKKDKSYDLIQSCMFGLGLLAQFQPHGQFAQLADTLNFISTLCNPQNAVGLSEDAAESFKYMSDNSMSTLAKVIIFQNDGNLVNDNMTKSLFEQLPLTTDVDEAQALHHLLLQKILEQNPALLKFPEELKAALKRMEAFSNDHPEEHEDILGDEAKQLFS